MFRPLNDSFAVAAQLQPPDMAAVAASGFKSVVNNRPDHEEPGQPTHAAMQAAALAAGLQYVHIPIPSASQTEADIAAMNAAVQSLPAPVLAFCRSGARSARLYMLSQQE